MGADTRWTGEMSELGGWHAVADMAQFPEGAVRTVFPKGVALLLVRRGADVFALSNRCPHMGCPLAQGTLEGDILRCPCHDWTFDIRTGELTLAREIKVPTYRTKVESGRAFVKMEV